ncbi:MAG: PIN domain-containing protein [Bacteroidetes bacterium]|nr:PIN domain-containing protein [Candidatus Omnitrophota bacterium]MBU1128729.1 PIN domain-containing protein [Candidatus Omnitrophota bacterium]MBU1800610.1 PIN domain-containing protein [Bacteroidota bacterium]
MELFVDTSAFISLANRKDQFHPLARGFLETIDSRTKFHSSNYIIDEAITRIRITAGHASATAFGKNIFSSKLYQIHYVNQEVEQEAFKLFEKYSDKKLSFTDCTSFALMKGLNIKKAFAFDEDFVHSGFETVPKR